MPSNRLDRQGKKLPMRAVLPRTVEQRLKRMEDLLLEMRHEQDVVLKMLKKTQVQLDALTAKVPTREPVPNETARTAGRA